MTITPNELRKWREQQNMSIRQLSERCGVSAAAISNFENGKSSLSDANLAKLLPYICDAMPPSLLLKYLQLQCESGKCKPELILERGEELLKRANELMPSEHADLLILLSEKLAFMRTRLDDVVEYAQQAVAINGTHSGSSRRWSRASLALAMGYYLNGMYGLAIDTAKMVKSQLIDIHFIGDMLVRAYSILTISTAAIGDHYMAKQYSEQSLTYLYATTTDDERLRALANNAYVKCDWCIESKLYDDAIEACMEAYHLYTKLNACHSALAMRNNLAYALAKCGELDKAAAIADEVIKVQNDATTLAYAERVHMEIAIQKGNVADAVRIATMLIDDANASTYLRVDTLCKLATLQSDKAREHLLRALNIVAACPQMRYIYNRVVTQYAQLNGLPGPDQSV